jgi:hypothetical protein
LVLDGPPGSYKAKLTADGMEDDEFLITVRKGDQKPFDRVMKPRAPALATLAIEGGTPGATVSVDDARIDELDSQGNLTYLAIAPGIHKIQLSKSGYGSLTFNGQAFFRRR